ncbi:MAG: MMPL family transporter [bacterium]|nr:MMPL family transporter [Acidimicrobiia bacterium]MCY4650424.1 MMPL family transporter [bacterium]
MRAFVKAFASLVSKAPWAVVITTLVLFGVFGSLSTQVEIGQGNEGLSPDNAELLAADRIRDLFGQDSQEGILQVIVRNEGGDVFTKEAFETVTAINSVLGSETLSDNLSSVPGRGASFSYLDPAISLAAQRGTPVASDEDVKNLYIEATAGPGANPQFTSLISQDGNASSATAQAGLVLVFTTPPAVEGEEALDEAIDNDLEVAEALRAIPTPDGLEVIPFSFNLLFEDSGDGSSEIGRLFGMAALIILVILCFVYWLKPAGKGALIQSGRRTLADTLLTLFTIFAAITFMQGIGVLLVRAGVIASFNNITQIIPILLIGLGVDYGIHVTSRYREEIGRGQDVDGAVRTAIGTVGIALALATVTTAIGFLTNVLSPVPALKDFGILAAIGIAVSFILTLTFFPAARRILDRRTEREGRLSWGLLRVLIMARRVDRQLESKRPLPVTGMKTSSNRLLPRLIASSSVLAEKVPFLVVLVALVLGGMGVWGLSQLEVRFSFTDFLPSDAPGVRAVNILQEEFGGGLGESTQVLIEGEDLSSPQVHNALVSANRGLAEVGNIVVFETPFGKTPSSTSPISVLNSLTRGGPQGPPNQAVVSAAQAASLDVDLRAVPDSDVTALWDTMLVAAPQQAGRVLHQSGSGYDALLFDISTQAGETEALQLRRDLLENFSELSDLGISVIATSTEIITNLIIVELADSQTRSLLFTLVVATLVLMISFWFENRRPLIGVITMIPVALVVFWTYGLMYATGIPIGPVTATLSALSIGIGVPYTIHIARRFGEDRTRFEQLNDALRSTSRHTGGALAGSAFTTMAGFGILITSRLTPFQQMGQVTVYAVGLSLVAAILVLPSMLALWERWHLRRARAV